MSNRSIVNLRDHPEHLTTLASWHHNEWAYLNPNASIERRRRNMQDYLKRDFIPSTFMAFDNSRLLGSAAIVENDMDTRHELSPWLASVFVHPDFRCQGVATQLIEHCAEEAAQHGFKKLYLFTDKQSTFYQKRGWQMHESTCYRGIDVDILWKAL